MSSTSLPLAAAAIEQHAQPDWSGMSDEALVARLRELQHPRRQRGGAEAARVAAQAGEVLVRRYHQPLLRYLQRLCGSDQMAEELHQQTWLSVLEHADRFDGGSGAGGFKAWLFRIATNKANDHWRSHGREKAAKQGLRLVTDQDVPAADQRHEGAEEQAKLHRAIAQLPEPQRQVLLLRYYGNMKFVEIAELLGCPLNTALGRMHKAILKLKHLMDPDRS